MSIRLEQRQIGLFIFLISITFLGDILRRISFLFDLEFTRYTSLSKIIFIGVSFIYAFIYFKEEIKHNKTKLFILKLSTLLIFFAAIGQLSLVGWDSFASHFIKNIEFLVKYLFLPYLLILFLNLRDNLNNIEKLIKIFEVFFFVNIVTILIGFFFNIDIFSTYDNDIRFGYKGIYSMSGQTSLYFILMIFYYTHKLIFGEFDKWIFTKLVVIIITSFLIGTKRIYLFMPLLAMYYLIVLKGYKKKITIKFIIGILLLLIIVYDKLSEQISDTLIMFQNIYNEEGLMTVFTSFRSDLFIHVFNYRILNKWTSINYLFGGMDFTIGRSQMGFVDLWLFFGIFGVLIYAIFYKILLNFKFSHNFYWFFLVSLLIIVFLADAFVLDTNVPILFFLVCSKFYSIENKKKRIEKQF